MILIIIYNLYFVGIILFPSKATKSTFRKVLITVGYAHAPMVFNVLILDYRLLYLMFIPYIWYNVSLIVGINQILEHTFYKHDIRFDSKVVESFIETLNEKISYLPNL